MNRDPLPPARATPRRWAWMAWLGLAVLVLAVLAGVAIGRDAPEPDAIATPAAECEEQPPPTEFAVAECDAGAEAPATTPAPPDH